MISLTANIIKARIKRRTLIRFIPCIYFIHWVFGRLGSGLRMYKYSASCFKTPMKKLYPKDTAIKKLHIISAMKM